MSGRVLERVVQGEIEEQIKRRSLESVLKIDRWDEIQHKPVRRILSETLWMRGKLQEYTAESAVDFVATEIDEKKEPAWVIAVYSCKASLRERFQQDLYWAERFRSRGIRFCFITIDNDGVLTKTLQSQRMANKQAKMAAALYDRVYLLTSLPVPPFSVFRPLDVLIDELEQWHRTR